jgi:DNA invertase Pin-like site-specific DNA recombinase
MQIVAVYARASKDRELKRVSTARQITQATKLATELFPGVPVRTYEDNDLTAADPSVERPEYKRLVADIRRGDVLQVVCHAQPRLVRQPAEWNELVVTLTKAGITKVHTVLAGPVSVEPGNRLVGSIMNLIDAEEVERTRARTLSAHAQLADEGRPPGGLQYGYRYERGDDGRASLVIEPEQATVVRLICDRLIEGYSVRGICAELDAAGVATPRAIQAYARKLKKPPAELTDSERAEALRVGRWNKTGLKAVVSKPAVAGFRGHRGQLIPTDRWEPIIEPERWRKALRALGSATVLDSTGKVHPSVRTRRATPRRWLLTGGLAVCGRCRSKLGVIYANLPVGATERIAAYGCHTSVGSDACGRVSISPAETVEEYVVLQVLDALDRPEVAARLLSHPDPERARLLGELAEAEAVMNEAAELRGAGIYDKPRWERQFYPAKARADAARAALDALPDPHVDLPPADQVREAWEEMPLRARRALLERFVEAVEIAPAASRGRSTLTAWERVEQRVTIRWRA